MVLCGSKCPGAARRAIGMADRQCRHGVPNKFGPVVQVLLVCSSLFVLTSDH